MASIVSVKNVSVSYGSVEVLANISFDVAHTGALVGIIGPNGAGKSTLIKTMLGLIRPECGCITYKGHSVKAYRRRIAYVPQKSTVDWDFPITVMETVLLGTYPHLPLFRRPGKRERAQAMAYLDQVGMADYATRHIAELSGGQQQRVFIARALVQQADILFLDEPLSAIDVHSQKIIFDILHGLRDEGKLLFVVHHDIMHVRKLFDQAILLNKELLAYGPVEEVLSQDVMPSVLHDQFSILHNLGAE